VSARRLLRLPPAVHPAVGVAPFPRGHDSRFWRFTGGVLWNLRRPQGPRAEGKTDVLWWLMGGWGWGLGVAAAAMAAMVTRRETKTSPRNLTAGKLRRRWEGKETGADDEEQRRAFIGFDECMVSRRNRRTRTGRRAGCNARGHVTDASWDLTNDGMSRDGRNATRKRAKEIWEMRRDVQRSIECQERITEGMLGPLNDSEISCNYSSSFTDVRRAFRVTFILRPVESECISRAHTCWHSSSVHYVK